MVLSNVFERFVKSSPVAVMARALMERALEPSVVDALFRKEAQQQYEKELLFSSLVELMALVVCGMHGTVRIAYLAMREQLPVTLTALYAKLNRVEVGTCQALVADSAQRLRPVIEALGTPGAWLPGHRIKVLDGNHIASTERRLEVLRDCAAGPLPGQSLVVLEPETGLATQMVGCEDGHAQERSLLEPVLAAVESNDVYIADRNFCTLGFLIGIAKRDGFFVIRHHANMPFTSSGTLRHRGRTESGEVLEQVVTLKLGEEELVARRIVMRLDTPTRDGDTEMSILTNLSSDLADAAAVAGLYRERAHASRGTRPHVFCGTRCVAGDRHCPRGRLRSEGQVVVVMELGRPESAEDNGPVAVKGVAEGADAGDNLGGPDHGRAVGGRGLVVEGAVRDAEGALKHVEGDEDDGDVSELGRGGEFAEGLVLVLHRRLGPAILAFGGWASPSRKSFSSRRGRSRSTAMDSSSSARFIRTR